MLQDIRKSTRGTAAKIVVGLIVLSFSIFGIESILVGSGGSSIAEVNGEEITPEELQQSVNTEKRRLISVMGDNLDPAMLDDQRLSAQALNGLINRKLLAQSASAMKLAVSEREIGLVIGGMDQFQIDGAFSPDIYKSVLSSAGYTPAYFKQSLRADMVLNQLSSGLAGSEFTTPAELTVNARVITEQRDVRYFTIPLEKYTEAIEIDPIQIEAYYTDNSSDFRTPESVDLDYIELSIDAFLQPVEESALLEAYELAKQDYQFQTENRVSHILFEATQEGDLQQRIADAQAQLAAGHDFAEVAGALSDDVGSAGNGGDLGYSSGDAFPEEMELAIAQLELNVVSAPVQTDAGTHLIIVTERREGEVASLEEMRGELRDRLQAEEAQIVLLRTVESLRDLSFNAENLEGPAAELALKVEQSKGIIRSHADGLFANPSLLAAAFSAEVLEAGHNSDVIELGGNQFVVLRVRQHNSPELQALTLVQDEIVEIIKENNARVAVVTAAEDAVQQLRSGVTVEQFALQQGYEWQVELGASRFNTTVPRSVLQRAFELPLPTSQQGASEFIVTATGDAQVFELVRVNEGQYDRLTEEEQQGLQRQVDAEYRRLVNTEFQRGLRDNADITVL
ncbi:MAG: peptidylprolyl isomerase [Gammaproteobacteria bacterium]|nr:MAG: peptidylprolyl isomerase [Gammaproteobacteria bacterium]RLA61762.1 MAG: peptidylprolyl isomerase [Gammaproteobacteria bacterium]